MRLVVTTDTDQLYNLEIDSSMAVEDLKALLESEVGQHGKSEKLVMFNTNRMYTSKSGIPPEQQELVHNGRVLDEAKKLLQEYGVAQDDLILMQRKAVGTPAAGAATGATSPARYIFLIHCL